ncbi:MAG: hypothetical protein COT73_03215 [Bdellovibrio sp. CG10_big_fil_rev_8_21_14_0_10_47_8]|nr:MAG: hypothetical protein COT73_03215 [Bdellovibrio sp. CG10_big_fil_rev_8_21_14_0_10_47_8]
MLNIYVDADGCAVKNEVYKVADRYKMKVFVVANKAMTIPQDPNVQMVVVSGDFDAADDWIVEKIEKGDIAITADILLADRCIKKQARVLGPKGIEFTEDSIGSALAMRELMTNLRHMGEMRGGPAPMEKKDRSQFLSELDRIIQALRRGA